jgi:hypothetical protein
MARTGDTASLRMRLSLAFVAVALSAVALLAVVTAGFAASDVNELSHAQRDKLTQAISVVAGASRREAGSWSGANLMPALELAPKLDSEIRVTPRSG